MTESPRDTQTAFGAHVLVEDDDRVALSATTSADGDQLKDELRGVSIPLNPAAQFLAREMAYPASVSELAGLLAREFEVSVDVARADVRAFCGELDSLGLLSLRRNVVQRLAPRRLLEAGTRIVSLGWGAPPAHRYPATPIGVARAVLRTLWPLLASAAFASALIASMLATSTDDPAALKGGSGAALIGYSLIPLGLITILGLFLALHEGGHALVARREAAAQFVVARGVRLFVSHNATTAGGLRKIAIAGPAAALAGMGAALGASFTLGAHSFVHLAIVVSGGVHAWSLTPWSGDGKAIWHPGSAIQTAQAASSAPVARTQRTGARR